MRMFRKKRKSWYLLAFWALLFAWFLYMVARMFLKASTRQLNKNNGHNPWMNKKFYKQMKKDPIKAFFV
ncbi:MAG: hypothetical protein GF398_09060 [Chitinivibrionales bacterium]|nr:hypothetical protein [Chitinivibrionales bacterium]